MNNILSFPDIRRPSKTRGDTYHTTVVHPEKAAGIFRLRAQAYGLTDEHYIDEWDSHECYLLGTYKDTQVITADDTPVAAMRIHFAGAGAFLPSSVFGCPYLTPAASLSRFVTDPRLPTSTRLLAIRSLLGFMFPMLANGARYVYTAASDDMIPMYSMVGFKRLNVPSKCIAPFNDQAHLLYLNLDDRPLRQQICRWLGVNADGSEG